MCCNVEVTQFDGVLTVRAAWNLRIRYRNQERKLGGRASIFRFATRCLPRANDAACPLHFLQT